MTKVKHSGGCTIPIYSYFGSLLSEKYNNKISFKRNLWNLGVTLFLPPNHQNTRKSPSVTFEESKPGENWCLNAFVVIEIRRIILI
jgi:hypothetical protein